MSSLKGPEYGKVRGRDSIPYGEAVMKIRDALREHGAIEARSLADAGTLTSDQASSALQDEVRHGRAVKLFRGVYARPDVAAAVRAAIRRCNLTHRSTTA